MKRSRPTFAVLACLATLAGGAVVPTAAKAKDLLQMLFHMERPAAVADPSVEQLAEQIDWLEKHIDSYGSVVAKQPDIWGQARLTKHRQEYEREMYQQLRCFDIYLQGTISQSDQAFLANAFTLQAAASAPKSSGGGMGAKPASSIGTTSVQVSSAPSGGNASSSNGGSGSGGNASSSNGGGGSGGGGAGGGGFPPDPTNLITDKPSDFFNSQRPAFPIGNFSAGSHGIGIEPTIALDQRDRYLNHLHALRRRNEGDDTADSAGYALNLVRIPISILPGKRTHRGYGAEITITARAHLSPALLPATFRNLVVNDLVDQLSLPITRVADQIGLALKGKRTPSSANYDKLWEGNIKLAELRDLLSDCLKNLWAATGPTSRLRQARNPLPPTQVPTVFGVDELAFIARQFYSAYHGPNVRWNEDDNAHVMYLDVQKFLLAEVQSAYDMLAQYEGGALWGHPGFDLGALAAAIRSGQFHQVCQMRENFFRVIRHTSAIELLDAGTMAEVPEDECDEEVVRSLAWGVLVVSALLNQQLIEDMQEMAQASGCAAIAPEGMQFYLPNPDAAARETFNNYVRCRWPLHVFALDPSVEEQNIASDFTRRRELQLALALGFTQGKITANNLMQFARRLETEIQTIELNETAVGFSHGDDTFGWRFYPRLQPPPTQGTLETFGQTLFGGPRYDADILHRKLEPGVRECVALIIMPSFVPQVTLETRADWIRLNSHSGWLPTKHKRELSMVDTMKLSRSITSMHAMAATLCDSQSYRPVDLRLLMNRVHQLDRQLPMQWMLAQVPIENTLGGYQMFNNGATDLAPELHGWYGAPGILLSSSQPPAASQGCSACSANAMSPAAASPPATGSPTPATGAPTPAGGNATGAARRDSTSVFALASTGAAAGASGKSATASGANAAGSQAPAAGSAPATSKTPTATQTPSACQAPACAVQATVQMPPDCCCSGTTVFLVGNHFSTHDTRIIAGGVCVPDMAVRLLSRQVMQVTIPWTAQMVKIEGDHWVDVHVATPYGVTGHLHIPVVTAPSLPAAGSATVPQFQAQLGAGQELVVKYKFDGADFTFENALAGRTKPKITMQCLDKQLCQALKPGYQLGVVVNHGQDRLCDVDGLANVSVDAAKASLSAASNDVWAVIRAELTKAENQAGVQQALLDMRNADSQHISLDGQLFLRHGDEPDVIVLGTLTLTFEETKGRDASSSQNGASIGPRAPTHRAPAGQRLPELRAPQAKEPRRLEKTASSGRGYLRPHTH